MDSEKIFHHYQPLLFSVAYNMLGSVMDAEDCVQETFLRWHRAYGSSEAEAIHSPRNYLCTIVTNLCINHLKSARVRRETYSGVWLPEPVLNADPVAHVEAAEILSIAFLRILEALSPIERAVFLLRQVFDYNYDEIASMVGKSERNCRQIVHRARQHLALQRPRYPVSSERRTQFYKRFMQASTGGNIDALLEMLTEDVALYSDGGETHEPIYGAAVVARVLMDTAQRATHEVQWHWQEATINGRPGLIVYLFDKLYAVFAFELVDERIQEIDIIVKPEKLQHFLHRGGDTAH